MTWGSKATVPPPTQHGYQGGGSTCHPEVSLTQLVTGAERRGLAAALDPEAPSRPPPHPGPPQINTASERQRCANTFSLASHNHPSEQTLFPPRFTDKTLRLTSTDPGTRRREAEDLGLGGPAVSITFRPPRPPSLPEPSLVSLRRMAPEHPLGRPGSASSPRGPARGPEEKVPERPLRTSASPSAPVGPRGFLGEGLSVSRGESTSSPPRPGRLTI